MQCITSTSVWLLLPGYFLLKLMLFIPLRIPDKLTAVNHFSLHLFGVTQADKTDSRGRRCEQGWTDWNARQLLNAQTKTWHWGKPCAEGGEGIRVLPFASLCVPSLPGINVFVHMKAESDYFPHWQCSKESFIKWVWLLRCVATHF